MYPVHCVSGVDRGVDPELMDKYTEISTVEKSVGVNENVSTFSGS